MSKRTSRKPDKQAITASPPSPASSSAIQAQPPAPKLPLLPDVAKGIGPWWVAALLVLGIGVPLALVLAVVWADRGDSRADGGPELKKLAGKEPRKEWVPQSQDDHLIDAFARLRNTDSPDAWALLGLGKTVMLPDRPLREDEERVLTAELLLRSDGLRIFDVRPGEPDGNGGQVQQPGRYTFITRGSASTPLYQVLRGKKVTNAQRLVTAPDVVVELRDGKLHALRAQLH